MSEKRGHRKLHMHTSYYFFFQASFRLLWNRINTKNCWWPTYQSCLYLKWCAPNQHHLLLRDWLLHFRYIYIFFPPISLACLLCFSKRFRSKKWAAAHNQQSSKSSCCGYQQQGAIPVVAPIFENDEIKKTTKKNRWEQLQKQSAAKAMTRCFMSSSAHCRQNCHWYVHIWCSNAFTQHTLCFNATVY